METYEKKLNFLQLYCQEFSVETSN